MLMGFPGFLWCLLTALFVTRDHVFIIFSLNQLQSFISFFVFPLVHSFFVSVSCWACVLYLLQRLRVLNDFYCIFHSLILKNTKQLHSQLHLRYGFEEVLALDFLDESYIQAFIQEGLHWHSERNIYLCISCSGIPCFSFYKDCTWHCLLGVHIYFTAESQYHQLHSHFPLSNYNH